jgi:hypothetical protein
VKGKFAFHTHFVLINIFAKIARFTFSLRNVWVQQVFQEFASYKSQGESHVTCAASAGNFFVLCFASI